MSIFKSILVGLLLLVSSAASQAAPFVSPQDCQDIARELATIAVGRDQGMRQEVFLAELQNAMPDESNVAFKFYSFWIKSIYGSKMTPPEVARAFFYSCLKEQGDIAKLMGDEV